MESRGPQSACEFVSCPPQRVPEATELKDTELNVSLSSKTPSIQDFCFSLCKTHILSQCKCASKYSNHLDHNAKDSTCVLLRQQHWAHKTITNYYRLEFARTCLNTLLLHADLKFSKSVRLSSHWFLSCRLISGHVMVLARLLSYLGSASAT